MDLGYTLMRLLHLTIFCTWLNVVYIYDVLRIEFWHKIRICLNCFTIFPIDFYMSWHCAKMIAELRRMWYFFHMAAISHCRLSTIRYLYIASSHFCPFHRKFAHFMLWSITRSQHRSTSGKERYQKCNISHIKIKLNMALFIESKVLIRVIYTNIIYNFRITDYLISIWCKYGS